MNNISIDISGKIDPDRVSVLRSIKEVADSLGIHFFVVGAFARDVVFEHVHQVPAPRSTRDIDLGVEVSGWEEFHRLIDALVERGLFKETSLPHRYIANASVIVDMIPYGGITGEAKQISWPPEHDMVMSMLGFEEAYRYALNVRLHGEPPLDILVPSVPALTVLKIISWADAYPERERDAQDLLFILENYLKTGIEDELYEAHANLLVEEGYDNRLASVRLLGLDIARLFDKNTVDAVTAILTRETDEEKGFRLLRQMLKGVLSGSTRFRDTLLLLRKLLQDVK
ncbi:MAG: nucleotidyl transferase AbiEii/AbiGii toxin family protein [Nitrospirae bacterium]|nr:nucleotidyl transferase AbiEii/AbiGii toxin family protein [Nitrospirota bacterium]MBI5696611.1 nucleotidyl transferase AbiEii/AbiGii toxin family protein [Nitrospirota bacterium]